MAVEIPAIVKTVITVAPALKDIQLISGLIVALSTTNPINDADALSLLQKDIDQLKKTRQKLRDQNNKRVIKISDAMDCVENNVNGKLLLKMGQAIVNVLSGNAADVGSLIIDGINACFLEKALPQSSRRQRTTYRYAKREI
jgi:hypothetical protein